MRTPPSTRRNRRILSACLKKKQSETGKEKIDGNLVDDKTNSKNSCSTGGFRCTYTEKFALVVSDTRSGGLEGDLGDDRAATLWAQDERERGVLSCGAAWDDDDDAMDLTSSLIGENLDDGNGLRMADELDTWAAFNTRVLPPHPRSRWASAL